MSKFAIYKIIKQENKIKIEIQSEICKYEHSIQIKNQLDIYIRIKCR